MRGNGVDDAATSRLRPAYPVVGGCSFAVHPLNTSADTYIAGRADSLALAGMLSAFLFHHLYRQQQPRRALFFVAAMLCYVAALFSRENALLFPVLLVVLSGLRGDAHSNRPSPSPCWRSRS